MAIQFTGDHPIYGGDPLHPSGTNLTPWASSSLRLVPWGLIGLREALLHMVETCYVDSDSTRTNSNYEASTMFSANCLAILGPNHDLHALKYYADVPVDLSPLVTHRSFGLLAHVVSRIIFCSSISAHLTRPRRVISF